MKKKLAIGISDFKMLIDNNCYYVDKSLLIKELLDDGSGVVLLPRPRRFGKTLNLSMLRYFFEKTIQDNKYLFLNLKIAKNQKYMNKQGKYPVIFITFKDVKSSNWKDCFNNLKIVIKNEFKRHIYLLDSNDIDKYDRQYFESILEETANNAQFESSIMMLSLFLNKHHKENVIILIDEYDMPIQSGYINNYYNEVIQFTRNLLSGGLKDNINLEKGVVTGILKIAKESIFSGLNNPNVCTILNYDYSNSFGLLEEEVEEILNFYKIESNIDNVKKWYNGYVFGENVIYNPWSIINYVNKWKEGFRAYWINTSSNDLVKELITRGGPELKQDLELLIKGESLARIINEDIIFSEIENSEDAIWGFLLFCGYLKAVEKKLINGKFHCKLEIPNLEVKFLYEEIIMNWFSGASSRNMKLMLESLTTGDIDIFEEMFSEYLSKSLSYFDVGGKEPEKFYHAFVLGLLISLNENYEIKSNRESGYGRYDIMIIPKDKNNLGIIIEFKKVRKNETLETAADLALLQIKEKEYKKELIDRGIVKIIELGISFEGKNLLLKQRVI